MRDTQAQYAALPGLRFKAYSFERESGAFGGVYWWRDRASAQAWFSPEWHARVQRERGARGDVLLLGAPLTVDGPGGAPAADPDSPAVVTLVQAPWPQGASREALLAMMARSLPADRQIPGLLRKHVVLDEASRTVGSVVLWQDEASARAWFRDTEAESARPWMGGAPRVTWFDTPILLPGRDAVTAP
jgi:heme-degrading monooxygenase HmoA